MTELQSKLFAMQDLSYREFHSGLMPTVDKNKIIGIRVPALRSFAIKFSKTEEAESFMKSLPHRYYEEDNLHAFLIERVKDFDTCTALLDEFLPYVDNWATCDMMSPKVLKNEPLKLLDKIGQWLGSGQVYTVRYAIGLLMKYYLDEGFEVSYAFMVAEVKSEEYYVNMMRAWYFATALSKRYDDIIPFLTEHRLDIWTHNKTIQKAIESYRITAEQKAYLRTLKRKVEDEG